MVDVHRAHRSLEQGSVASVSRAILHDGRGATVNESYSFRTALVPPDGRRSDHLGLVPGASRRRTSLLPTLRFRLWHKRFFRFKLLRSCPLRPKTSPRLMLYCLRRKRIFRPTRPLRLMLFPIPALSRRPPGFSMKTCSGKFSWVAANKARVTPPLPLVAKSLESASPALAVGCHMVA